MSMVESDRSYHSSNRYKESYEPAAANAETTPAMAGEAKEVGVGRIGHMQRWPLAK